MKDPKNPSKANNSFISPAEYNKIICNYLPKDTYLDHLQKVDRDWYIEECYKIIRPIELGRKIKTIKNNPLQQSLF